MKITKVMFVGLISLLCSINSFTNTNSENDFKKFSYLRHIPNCHKTDEEFEKHC